MHSGSAKNRTTRSVGPVCSHAERGNKDAITYDGANELRDKLPLAKEHSHVASCTCSDVTGCSLGLGDWFIRAGGVRLPAGGWVSQTAARNDAAAVQRRRYRQPRKRLCHPAQEPAHFVLRFLGQVP